jgi:DNA-binding NarL/FixJ family response regulator
MPDALSLAERDAIDAFPDVRIQRIPRGASGLTPWLWSPKHGTIKDTSGKHWTPWGAKKHRLTASNGEVVSLWRAGLTDTEIGARLGISREAVKKRIRVMRRKGVDLPVRKVAR